MSVMECMQIAIVAEISYLNSAIAVCCHKS